MTATSVASRSSRVHDSGYKSATPKRPSIPPDTPDIEVEVSEVGENFMSFACVITIGYAGALTTSLLLFIL